MCQWGGKKRVKVDTKMTNDKSVTQRSLVPLLLLIKEAVRGIIAEKAKHSLSFNSEVGV